MINGRKLTAVLTLVISIGILTAITIITNTEFILPPFLATAATKYPDPDWNRHRSLVILTSYLLSGAVGVAFSLLHLYGLILAVVASFASFIIMVIINIEHPPAVLATFLGILRRVGPTYLLHPIMTGVLIIEGINYLITRYVEPKLKLTMNPRLRTANNG